MRLAWFHLRPEPWVELGQRLLCRGERRQASAGKQGRRTQEQERHRRVDLHEGKDHARHPQPADHRDHVNPEQGRQQEDGAFQNQRPETPGFEDPGINQAAREQSEHDQLHCHGDRDRVIAKSGQPNPHAGDPLRPGRAERRCTDSAQTTTGRPPPHGRDVVEQKTARQCRQHGRGGQPAQARLPWQARSQPVENRNPYKHAGISRCDRPDPAHTHQRRLVQVGADEGWQICGVGVGRWAVGAHVRSKPSSRRPGRPGLIALLEPYRAARAIRIGADTDPGDKSYHVPEAGS